MFVILLLILFLLITYGGVMFTGVALEVAGAVLAALIFLIVAIVKRRGKR